MSLTFMRCFRPFAVATASGQPLEHRSDLPARYIDDARRARLGSKETKNG